MKAYPKHNAALKKIVPARIKAIFYTLKFFIKIWRMRLFSKNILPKAKLCIFIGKQYRLLF